MLQVVRQALDLFARLLLPPLHRDDLRDQHVIAAMFRTNGNTSLKVDGRARMARLTRTYAIRVGRPREARPPGGGFVTFVCAGRDAR
jgi:hypothetical protein